MGKKLTTYEKLRRSFEAIGIELPKYEEGGLLSVVYDNYPCLLGILEEDDVFYLTECVVGPEGKIPKQVFETALEVTKSIHSDIDGDWNDGLAWISSSLYCMKGKRSISQKMLKECIKDFVDAHTLMECNVYLLMDDKP